MEKSYLRIFVDTLFVSTILLLVFNYSYWKLIKYEKNYINKPKGFFPLGNSGRYMSNYRVWPAPKILVCSEFENTVNFLDLFFNGGVNKTYDEIFSKSRFVNLKNALMNDISKTSWQLILFTQNPMKRFLDNFLDYCSMYSRYETESSPFCFYCNGEINCFLTNLFDYLKNKSWVKQRFEPSLRDRLFAPQFWKCNLKLDFSHYNIIQIDNGDNFYEKLLNIIRNYTSPSIDKTIVYDEADKIYSSLQIRRNKTLFNFYENLLTKNEYLLTKFVTIYFFDYYIFSYEIPYF
uniref:Sulfotransfer_1 domain-containing protein n=1 Tax=Strongyloides papillosus TaxID=174720 RepID=A0A0N5BXL8_STREA